MLSTPNASNIIASPNLYAQGTYIGMQLDKIIKCNVDFGLKCCIYYVIEFCTQSERQGFWVWFHIMIESEQRQIEQL